MDDARIARTGQKGFSGGGGGGCKNEQEKICEEPGPSGAAWGEYMRNRLAKDKRKQPLLIAFFRPYQ